MLTQKTDIADVLEYLDVVPLARFCEIMGINRSKARSKMRRGEWVEGKHYQRDPDGEIHIILSGYKSWVNQQQQVVELEAEKSRLNLEKKAEKSGPIKPLIHDSTQIPRLV